MKARGIVKQVFQQFKTLKKYYILTERSVHNQSTQLYANRNNQGIFIFIYHVSSLVGIWSEHTHIEILNLLGVTNSQQKLCQLLSNSI